MAVLVGTDTKKKKYLKILYKGKKRSPRKQVKYAFFVATIHLFIGWGKTRLCGGGGGGGGEIPGFPPSVSLPLCTCMLHARRCMCVLLSLISVVFFFL